MDPNTDSQIAGLSYIEKLRTEAYQEQNSQDPFAAVYDALTPDEPTRAWLIAKRLPTALIHLLTAQQNYPVLSSVAQRTAP